jgi:glycosyltransferase involved in cell wall biosynthesis
MNRAVIRSGVNGQLATSMDEWVAAIECVLRDPALSARFASAGRDEVVQHYSLDVISPLLLDVLEGCVSNRQHGQGRP